MRKIKGLAVASGGGHWEQLMLLSPSFSDCDITYVSTSKMIVNHEKFSQFSIISDTNRSNPITALKCLFQCVALIHAKKPDFVVSTGALPGLICLVVARLWGVRTIWVDSLANSERPSMCGRAARHLANRWFTQWEHLSRPGKGEYEGALL